MIYIFKVSVIPFAVAYLSLANLFFSNGRSCTVNTVLWNTIQLLFPEEVEVRKSAGAQNSREAKRQSPGKENQAITRNRSTRPSAIANRATNRMRRRRELPSQNEDAALALRLQREEFMGAFREQQPQQEEHRNTVSLARANLRAMASRAVSLRVRGGRPYLL